MTESGHSIGESIRARRAALGQGQRDLACAAGTTAAAISHIERGIRNPSAGLLARIASSLECSMDDLSRGAMHREDDQTIAQVAAAMRSISPEQRQEVLQFCQYLRHRNRRGK